MVALRSWLVSMLIIICSIIAITIIIVDVVRRHVWVFFRTHTRRGCTSELNSEGVLVRSRIGPPIPGTCGNGDG
jgi:hypothetical protein